MAIPDPSSGAYYLMSAGEDKWKRQSEPQQLTTRHAFLDTQVYHKLKHNPANKALKLLGVQIAAHRLVLHTTDITLSEISRQIGEDVEQARTALAKARKNVDRWRHSVPDIPKMPPLDDEIAERLFAEFRRAAASEWVAKEHRATEFPAAGVFADYFARRPPFDAPGSKEFPDAFVLHALESWCIVEGETMYVVTQDAAMLRYAEASPSLLPLSSIEELLAAAEASADDKDGDSEGIADALLNAPEFDFRFEQAISSHIDDLIFIYEGDLPNGEVAGADFDGVIRFVDYQIVSRTKGRLGLLVNTDIEVGVDVSFENRRYAVYDREDDLWLGGEPDSAIIRKDIMVEFYIEMEIVSGEIVRSDLIGNEYHLR